MLLLVSVAVVVAVGLLVGLSAYNKRSGDASLISKGYKLFPEPKGWLPVIGHLLVILGETEEETENPTIMATRYIKEIGGESQTYQLHLPGSRTYVLTANPDIVQHITSTKHEKNFKKGQQVFDQYQEFLGEGIFNVNGDEWRTLRSKASQLFRIPSLRKFVTVFDRNAERLFQRMEELRQRPSYKETGIDMQDMFMRYTLDSFAEIGFGVDLQAIEQEENHFAIAFDKVQTHSERRGRFGNWWKYLELVQKPREFQESLDVMNNHVLSIIRQRESEPVESLEGRTDILSQLLYEMRDEPRTPTRDKFLRDFVMNFLIAGRDTTAMLLTWTFHLLASHPEVERKCVEEVERVLGDEEPTWDNVKACTYIKMVLQETLRLFPPVPVDGYTCVEDDVLPGDYYVRKGEEVYYVAPAMHRRADLYPDPDAFKPERWEDPVKHPYAYVPFHVGPRQCLGKEMAYEEAKVMVINLLRRYRLRMHANYEPVPKVAIIMTSKNGMWMDVEDAK